MTNCKKNFGFTNKCGILMPISSLPSAYGIGSFGKEAYKFADFLSATGQKCWQVLPLNPTAYGDSPYQSPCSGAGNPYFIDLEILSEKGLLTKAEVKEAKFESDRVDYGRIFNTRYDILRKAYSRFTPDSEYKSYCRKNKDFLDDYSLFMALKVKNNYRSFIDWDEGERIYAEAKANAKEYEAEAGFWKWIQFEFSAEWSALRSYVNDLGIDIIGDIPIYVAYDSVEVWSHPELFALDGDMYPRLVAGCPPDAYAEEGQLWGNPIYEWEKMEKDGFTWWIERIKRALSFYDILRIDHFRGFAGYYVIPYGDKTAEWGWWELAPGKELFDAVKAKLPKARIIAEDLGFITEEVHELLDYTGFPGMKVLQFGIGGEESSLPCNFKGPNSVVYSSSHDADCTRSFCDNLEGEALIRFKYEFLSKHPKYTDTEAVIAGGMESIGNLMMVPMQDYLELTNEEGRMNVPAVAQGNWVWRLKKNYCTEALKKKVLKLCKCRI